MISPMKLIKIKYSIELLVSILVTSFCPEIKVEGLEIKNWLICTYEGNSFNWSYDNKET